MPSIFLKDSILFAEVIWTASLLSSLTSKIHLLMTPLNQRCKTHQFVVGSVKNVHYLYKDNQ